MWAPSVLNGPTPSGFKMKIEAHPTKTLEQTDKYLFWKFHVSNDGPWHISASGNGNRDSESNRPLKFGYKREKFGYIVTETKLNQTNPKTSI